MMATSIGELLKKERSKRGMTLQEVGEGIGCSPSYIYRLEKGARKQPSYAVAKAILDFFELPENSLTFYESKKKSVELKMEMDLMSLNMDTENFSHVQKYMEIMKHYQQALQEEKAS